MKKPICAFAVSILLTLTCGAQQAPGITPEAGFISSEKYTNAFFGFALPLPKDSAFRESTRSFKAEKSLHVLFGLQAVTASASPFHEGPKMTIFLVTATQSKSASVEEVRNAASGATGQSAKEIEIGGKEFWKRESQEKVPAGKIWSVCFATAIDGYILRFYIESFDEKVTKQLQRSIEAISFFDPSRAEDVAGPDSRVFYPAVSNGAAR